MDDDSDSLYLKMLLELIPQDVPKDYAPYSEVPLTHCNYNFHKSLFDHSSLPFDWRLNGGTLSSEILNDSTVFSENIAVLPEVSEMCPIELKLIEPLHGNEEILLPDDTDDESPDNPIVFDQTENSVDLKCSTRTIQVQCLQGMKCLLHKCEADGLKFNDSSEWAFKQDINYNPCNVITNGSHQEVQIDCLYTIETLIQMCNSQNVRFNPSPYGSVFGVDMIFEHKVIDGETYYYVKWKKLPSEHTTWQPSSSLTSSHNIIQYYHAMKSPKTKLDNKLLNYFVQDLISRSPTDILTLTKTCALVSGKSETEVKKLNLTVSQMKARVKEVLKFSHVKLHSMRNNLFKIMQFGEARKWVLINLKEWQMEINSKNKSVYIEVENDVDLETAPSKFKFIHDYINTVINIPEEPVIFCNCQNCYSEQDKCCPHNSEGHFAYNRYQRLILEPGYPIFECNSKCSCDSNCINRVVQHGQKVKVGIFRTSNGCGWGLKTLENIEKGQFVLEYLGEIITSDAADARGVIYDYVGRSYLFDLDYGVDNPICCYTVDAGHVGNASHFINHSCNPNLHVFAVWINQPDPSLPRLAFFAKRKILKGEELTFDYKMVQKNHFGTKNSETGEKERVLCKCNSKNCRKYLF